MKKICTFLIAMVLLSGSLAFAEADSYEIVTDEINNRVLRINTSTGQTWILVYFKENEALEWCVIPEYNRTWHTPPDIGKDQKKSGS